MSNFYCTSIPVRAGSIIEPGNWGRMLRLYAPQNTNVPAAWVLIREYVYELIRRDQFPSKPSRLHGLFVCSTEASLAEFRSGAGRPFDLSYEVELVDPQAPSHVGDWSLANFVQTDDVRTIERRAAMYWQPTEVVLKPELLTLSPIKILRQIQP
jgi:hypothetical protein